VRKSGGRYNTQTDVIMGCGSIFKSWLLTRETKVRLYITLVRPVLTYGCETLTLTKADELALSTFERKVLQKTYGPVYERGE
jgi:hypothetical protein